MSFGTVREIFYFLVIIGLVVFLYINERDILIKPPTVQGSTVLIKPIYRVFELPRHEIDMIDFYIDTLQNEHQIYADERIINTDSVYLRIKPTIDVNVEKRKSIWNWDDIELKTFEKIITNNIIDTVYVDKIKEVMFLNNNWFWNWFVTTLLFLGTLGAIIFG